MPNATLTAAEVLAIAKGQQVKPEQRPHVDAGARVRLVAEDRSLVGIGSWKAGRLVPEKIFVPAPGASRDDGTAGQAPVLRAATEPPLRVIRPRNRMVVVPGIDALTPELGRLYLAVGVFDGLHRGHQYLLRELRHAAEKAGARPAIVTFDAHPEEVIEGLAPPLLCDPDERLVRLQAAGIEVTVVQHFDHDLRMTTYDQFVARIASRVDLGGFAMTADAAFGYERGGTAETLTELGARTGFEVTVVSSFLLDGEQVRSSDIRRRVAEGDLASARRLLGRSLSLTSVAPAADRAVDGRLAVTFELPVQLPPDGRYTAMLGPSWSIGRRPLPATQAAEAVVSDGSVFLEGDPPAPGCLRIVFMARTD
jgi:riboflavin kinase/FMN adenylyltransferase